MIKEIKELLHNLANKKHAVSQRRFFKTGKGEYAEGDIFIGVRVPEIRKLAKQFRHAPINVPKRLLKSKIHEQRLLALFMLIDLFNRADEAGKKSIYDYYLNQIQYINNWDLVDISAEKIVGAWLFKRNRRPIRQMVKSKNLWERRISIISTFYFIRQEDFSDTLELARILLKDEQDLIHKATGWMLREVGKRDRKTEELFLKQHYRNMPRTMLRYAIERFPETIRKGYLKK